MMLENELMKFPLVLKNILLLAKKSNIISGYGCSNCFFFAVGMMRHMDHIKFILS